MTDEAGTGKPFKMLCENSKQILTYIKKWVPVYACFVQIDRELLLLIEGLLMPSFALLLRLVHKATSPIVVDLGFGVNCSVACADGERGEALP